MMWCYLTIVHLIDGWVVGSSTSWGWVLADWRSPGDTWSRATYWQKWRKVRDRCTRGSRGWRWRMWVSNTATTPTRPPRWNWLTSWLSSRQRCTNHTRRIGSRTPRRVSSYALHPTNDILWAQPCCGPHNRPTLRTWCRWICKTILPLEWVVQVCILWWHINNIKGTYLFGCEVLKLLTLQHKPISMILHQVHYTGGLHHEVESST